jgi:predicted phosphodiesterase
MQYTIDRRQILKMGTIAAFSSPLTRTLQADNAPLAGYEDAVLVEGQPPQPEKGSFTIAVLPDTQNYSQSFPQIFTDQTSWIVDNQQKRNIACVLHLGDVTNQNTEDQWTNAVRSMNVLDGHLPYFMVPGNHDYSEGGSCKNRNCGLTAAFPVDKFRELPTFGGTYDKEPDRIENSYHLFSAGGRQYLSLCLEFGPRKDVVRWANEVAGKHKQRAIILTTHAYMYFDDSRYDWKKFGDKQSWNPHAYGVAQATDDDVLDGQQLWDNLINQHDNFILALNGHVLGDGLGKMTSTTAQNRQVHQLLVNFQMRPQGGDGWLRLLEFLPNGKTIRIFDYSPSRDQTNQSPQNSFTLELS